MGLLAGEGDGVVLVLLLEALKLTLRSVKAGERPSGGFEDQSSKHSDFVPQRADFGGKEGGQVGDG